MNLVKDDKLKRVEGYDYPPQFKSFMKNVVTYISNKNLEEANWAIARRKF